MAKENGEKGSVPRRKSAREGDSQIFVADASAEAGRLLSALQAKGYAVVDVPLGLLPNRVHYEVPELVICDADAHEAQRRLTEMLDACSTAPKIFLLGQQDGALKRLPALKALATDLLFRPIDLDWAVRAVQVLVSSPRKGTHRPRILRSSRAPLVVAAARRPYRSDGRPPSSPSSSAEDLEVAWPVDSPPSRGPSPSDAASVGESSRPPRVSNSSAPPSSGRLSLSSDTQAVLEEGKRRVRASAKQAPRPVRLSMAGGAQDLEIPEEFLNALAEPLDDSEMDARAEKRDVSGRTNAGGKTNSGSPTRTGAKPPATGPGSENDSEPPVPNRPPTLPPSSRAPASRREREEQTNPGGKPPTQPPPQSETSSPFSRLPLDSALPPLDDLSDLLAPVPLRGPQTVPGRPPLATTAMEPLSLDSEPPGLLAATIPPPTRRGQLPEQGEFSSLPHHQAVDFEKITERPKRDRIVLPPSTALPLPAPEPEAHGHALRALAQAIRTRKTGAIAQPDQNGLRRIVLTDGDISTVTSSVEAEGLPQYLHAHGDLSDEALAALGNLPTFGRRSGAALVARGLLQQEDLWPVLRTHAEWILGRALLSEAETQFETKVPARVLEEPAVFGGAAGTEIYLETMRRILTPVSALALLGDEHTVLGLGEYESLLSESALSTEEQKEALAVVGRPLGPLRTSAPQLLPILAALSELGILTSGGKSKAKPKPSAAPSLVASVPAEKLKALSREMDGEAFRARVIRRRALVEDGDYFAILGVSRAATAYEVERARDALISEYADSRLTAATADLLPDLELIRATVEEAYLVLYDDVRRMRYRAALEAIPA